ncbi:DJ-1/PfpI family transcriptional regulator [Streptomyces malaysiensis]|uniref:DJ-1/PfpI family transcriptional regulator n=1 Tax=Streptomyces malaysiensis TaxID=92644 RepID=A0A7X6AUQ5_STRMQ|nr:DJ-1/PfpI family transcriptional regulator [Streptomyces malaysiensis]
MPSGSTFDHAVRTAAPRRGGDHAPEKQAITRRVIASRKSVVCHGPAALLAAVAEDGSHAYAGYRITAFTNEEEQMAGNADKAKWLLQDRLTEAGLTVRVGEPFAPHVEVDRNLVTGQNPASSGPLADELLKKLG